MMGAPVFLCGMMGCGKSSVGRLAALRAGVSFIDLDLRIERMFGATIAALFEQGEAAFRAREQQALRSLVAEPSFRRRTVFVATGGGAVVDPANRQTMDAVGRRVFLQVPLPQLAARLRSGPARAARPLVAESSDDADLAARLGAIWTARQSAYEDGALPIVATGSVEQVAERLLDALDLSPQVGDTRPA
ncbi:MAG: shikimate kinase [Myxococcota bacterium]